MAGVARGAVERRWKNAVWFVADESGSLLQDGALLAVLMDIRDELKTLNRIVGCPNFVGMPSTLMRIAGQVAVVDTRLRTISRKIPTRKRKRG